MDWLTVDWNLSLNGWKLALLVGNAMVALIAWTIRQQVRHFVEDITDRGERVSRQVAAVDADVKRVLTQVHAINGRVGRVEQWTQDHERHDEQRIAEIRADIRAMRARG